jgi:hypothetical protein
MQDYHHRTLIDEKQLAKIIKRSVQTLRNERCQGRGLPYIRIGRSIRYDIADVERYLKIHRIDPNECVHG